MNADKISSKSIFVEDDPFGQFNQGAVAAIGNLKEIAEGVKAVAQETIKAGNGVQLFDAASVQKMNEAISGLNNTTTAYVALQTKLAKLEQESEKVAQQQLRTQQQRKKNVDDLAKSEARAAAEKAKADKAAIKAASDQEKANAKAQSAYYRLSQQLIDNKKKVKDLLASGKELTEEDQKLIHHTQELDQKLKKIDATVGDHTRNVGAYSESLREVIAEMGPFGGLITRITRTLEVLEKQNEKSTSGFAKFGNALKAVGLGVALFAISAMADASKEANEMSEALKRTSERLDIFSGLLGKGATLSAIALKNAMQGINSDVGKARDLFAELIDVTIRQADAVRMLKIDLQKLTIEQDEFNQKANDTTIGYNERIAAQKESIELSKKIAEKNIEIAKNEKVVVDLEFAATEAAVGKGNVNKELKDKQLEATLKLNEAIAAGDLLELTNSEKIRQINAQRANEEIDLILKKRESANTQKAILEEELKDEKVQLEQRKKVADDLLQYNKKTTAEELRIFKEGYNIRFKSNELLQEQDAVALANKIKSLKTAEGHGLGEEGVAELAKIIKQYQENEIENNKTKKAQQEEEIKRRQKIAQIEQQILLISIKEREEATIAAAEKDKERYEKGNEDILKRDNVFNGKKLKGRTSALEDLKSLLEVETSYKEEAAKKQADIDIQNAKDTIYDKKVQAEEIKKIQEQLQADLNKIADDGAKKQRDLDKEEVDMKKKISDKRKEIIANDLNSTIDFTEQSLSREDELRQKQLDNDLDMRQRNILQQQQLAEAGRKNTLAFEQAAAAKDELQKQKLAETEKKREKAIAFLKLFAAYAEKGDPDQALEKTLVQMAIAGAIVESYKDGVEGVEGPGTETSDSILARLSKNESVVTASGTKENPGLATAMNKGKVDEYFEKKYLPKYMTDQNVGGFGQNVYNSLLIHKFAELKDELSEVKKVIKDLPRNETNLNNLGEVVNKKIEKGFIRITTHKPKQSPLNYT